MKKWLLLTSLILSLGVATGCSSNKDTGAKPESSTSTAQSTSEKETEVATKTFVDSAGRSVEVPTKITKIAPSGPLAQIVLYTAAPDLLAGIASEFSENAKPYFDEKYFELPVFGQFYGKNSSLNMEALSAAAPDVIIDIGEAKETIKEDMDALQDQLDIPTVFVSATLENMGETYKMLGDLLGKEDEMVKLTDYCNNVLSNADKISKEISDSDKKSVYYASGDAGLNTNAAGTIHAQVIDKIGAKNAAEGIEANSKGSGSTVSMEQLLQWQPDFIIASDTSVYDIVTTDASWQDLTAVKENKVFLVPSEPYNFLNSPPSVNQIIGIQWLGNLVYPDKFDFDIREEITNFYNLFYKAKVSSEQMDKLLTNAE